MARLVHKTETVAENRREIRIYENLRVRSDSAYLRVRCIRICLSAKQRVASQAADERSIRQSQRGEQ